MIIYGWGRKTVKQHGESRTYECTRCRNTQRFRLATVRKWFTLFFIPLIPYKTTNLEYCPVCSSSREITKEELTTLLADAQRDASYLATPR